MAFRKAFWRNWHLISACMSHDVDTAFHTAKELVGQGADPNVQWRVRGAEWLLQPGERQSPLLLACGHGHGYGAHALRLVELLLGAGARDDRALCVLAHRRTRESLEIARLLLQHGLDVKTTWGRRALCTAVESHNVDMVQLILKSGADVNFKTPSGKTLLWVTVQTGNVDIVRLIIENGALVDASTCPPLWTVCPLSFDDPTRKSASEMAKLLLQNGVDPNVPDGHRSPLERAVWSGNMKLAQILLAFEADPNVNDKNGIPLIVKVVQSMNVEMVKVLLAGGADADIATEAGCSLFELAIQDCDDEMVEALFQHQKQFLCTYDEDEDEDADEDEEEEDEEDEEDENEDIDEDEDDDDVEDKDD